MYIVNLFVLFYQKAAVKTVCFLQDREISGTDDLQLAIAEYARTHGRWLLRGLQLTPANLRYIRSHPVDGAVIYPRDDAQLKSIRRLAVPKVVVASGLSRKQWKSGCVGFDEAAIGAAAALHLIDRGFDHFMFVGANSPWAVERGNGFCAQLGQSGFKCIHFGGSPRPKNWPNWTDLDTPSAVDQLLDPVPTRCGVLACNDLVAQLFISACIRNGRRVPDDIAVVGVDDHILFCEFGQIPSSSVDPDIRQLGLKAAEMLESLMSKQAIPDGPVIVPPKGVVVRQSSDSYSTNDAEVLSALAKIRKSPNLSVDELASDTAMSRATLERRFRAALNRSPAEELRRHRLETARQMLLHTRRPISDIAADCGFDYLSTFSKLFRRVHGISPSDFRHHRDKPTL